MIKVDWLHKGRQLTKQAQNRPYDRQIRRSFIEH